LTRFACPQRRIEKVQAWLAVPNLLEANKDAEKGHVIEIDMNEIKEPILFWATSRPSPNTTKPGAS
jgi:aconitase B